MRINNSNSLNIGILFAICIIGFIQDLMGIDAYVEFIRNNWIKVPFYLWLLPFAYCIKYMARVMKEKE